MNRCSYEYQINVEGSHRHTNVRKVVTVPGNKFHIVCTSSVVMEIVHKCSIKLYNL